MLSVCLLMLNMTFWDSLPQIHIFYEMQWVLLVTCGAVHTVCFTLRLNHDLYSLFSAAVCRPCWIPQQTPTMSASCLASSVHSGSSVSVEHTTWPLALLTHKTHPTFCLEELANLRTVPHCLYRECLAHTYIALEKQKYATVTLATASRATRTYWCSHVRTAAPIYPRIHPFSSSHPNEIDQIFFWCHSQLLLCVLT